MYIIFKIKFYSNEYDIIKNISIFYNVNLEYMNLSNDIFYKKYCKYKKKYFLLKKKQKAGSSINTINNFDAVFEIDSKNKLGYEHRYIEDVTEKLPSEINELAITTSKANNRYFDVKEKNILVQSAWDTNCNNINEEHICKNKLNCKYDYDKKICYPNEDYRPFIPNVETTWDEVIQRSIGYLEQKDPYGASYGPYAFETTLIVPYLLEITKHGITTHDSQPGLYIVNWIIPGSIEILLPYIQKPYLFMYGPTDKINNLKQNLSDSKYIRLIDSSGYPIDHFDSPEYKDLVIGVDDSELNEEFFNYIFTSGFYKEIVAGLS
jgi:hypothetical protein